MTAAALLFACITGPSVPAELQTPGVITADVQPSTPPTAAESTISEASIAGKQPETDIATMSPRLRFGIGIISGSTTLDNLDYPGNSGAIATLFGLDLRAGVQVNDLVAILCQGRLTLLWPDVGGALMVEGTFTRFFSLGVGLGLDWLPGVTTGAGPASSLSLGIPVRIAFNIPTGASRGRARSAVALSLELTPGTTIAGNLASGFQLGTMGGVSFEIY